MIDQESDGKERPIRLYRESVVVFAGLPLTGKTAIAKKLIETTNYNLLDVDEIRRQENPIVRVLKQKEEKIAVERTYVRIFKLARKLLENEKPVIIAGVFSRPDPYHNQLKALVNELKIPLRFFYLEAPPPNEVERRIQLRLNSPDNLSNVTSYERFAEVEGRYKLMEGINVIRIPAQFEIDEKIALVKKNLEDLLIVH